MRFLKIRNLGATLKKICAHARADLSPTPGARTLVFATIHYNLSVYSLQKLQYIGVAG